MKQDKINELIALENTYHNIMSNLVIQLLNTCTEDELDEMIKTAKEINNIAYGKVYMSKTLEDVTIIQDNNKVTYTIARNGNIVKCSASLEIDGTTKHFRAMIDFDNMISTWVGDGCRMTKQSKELLDKYDLISKQ